MRMTILSPYYVFMCDCVFVDGCLANFSSKLSVANRGSRNADCNDSDDVPMALALRSLHFLSASQILFASY